MEDDFDLELLLQQQRTALEAAAARVPGGLGTHASAAEVTHASEEVFRLPAEPAKTDVEMIQLAARGIMDKLLGWDQAWQQFEELLPGSLLANGTAAADLTPGLLDLVHAARSTPWLQPAQGEPRLPEALLVALEARAARLGAHLPELVALREQGFVPDAQLAEGGPVGEAGRQRRAEEEEERLRAEEEAEEQHLRAEEEAEQRRAEELREERQLQREKRGVTGLDAHEEGEEQQGGDGRQVEEQPQGSDGRQVEEQPQGGDGRQVEEQPQEAQAPALQGAPPAVAAASAVEGDEGEAGGGSEDSSEAREKQAPGTEPAQPPPCAVVSSAWAAPPEGGRKPRAEVPTAAMFVRAGWEDDDGPYNEQQEGQRDEQRSGGAKVPVLLPGQVRGEEVEVEAEEEGAQQGARVSRSKGASTRKGALQPPLKPGSEASRTENTPSSATSAAAAGAAAPVKAGAGDGGGGGVGGSGKKRGDGGVLGALAMLLCFRA